MTLPTEALEAEYEAINKLVGSNIRMRRKLLGVTQQQLAEALGLTFQQVQKYEKGINRVSAPILWRIARVLQCDLMDLFKGAPAQSAGGKAGRAAGKDEGRLISFMAAAGGLELAEAYLSIPERHRRGLLLAGRAMARMAEEIDG